MKLSIVATLYCSELFVDAFYKRIRLVAESVVGGDWELIFVNDGSPDRSLHCAVSIAQCDNRVRVIDLSRNFGHHKALLTGLQHAHGDYIFMIDVDLEEQPELLYDFWRAIQADQTVDVIVGVQRVRKGGWFERTTGELFYRVYGALTGLNVENHATVRIMTRRFVVSLIGYKEHDFVFVLAGALAGYKQATLPISKRSREGTAYSIVKRLNVAIDMITSFTARPLIFMFYFGTATCALSFAGAVFLLYERLVLQRIVEGWTGIVLSIWFFGGLILACLGLLGVYIAKIFIQVKNRPFTIIREEVSFHGSFASDACTVPGSKPDGVAEAVCAESAQIVSDVCLVSNGV